MHEIVWSEKAVADFEAVHVRHQRAIRVAIDELRHQASAPPTARRKPVEAPLDELPHGAWELRIGDFRVFYSIDEAALTVTVLRVIFKGRWTTEAALRKSRRS